MRALPYILLFAGTSAAGAASCSSVEPEGGVGVSNQAIVTDAGDEDSSAPPGENCCSNKCSSNAGVNYTRLSAIPACAVIADPQVLEDTTTKNITKCAAALACYLERAPTKAEFLDALGMDNPDSAGLFSFTSCVAKSFSTQPIPDPEVDENGKVTQVNGMRCASGHSVDDTAWVTWTDDPSDASIEMVNIRTGTTVCGTDPVGLNLDNLCEQIDGLANATDVGTALFTKLSSDAAGGIGEDGAPAGDGDCTSCHSPIVADPALVPDPQSLPPDLVAGVARTCFNFALEFPFFPVCPLSKGYVATCGHSLFRSHHTAPRAKCADGKPPKCDVRWEPLPAENAYRPVVSPECADGSVPADCANIRCVNASIPVPGDSVGNDPCPGIKALLVDVTAGSERDTFLRKVAAKLCPGIPPQAPPPHEPAGGTGAGAGGPASGAGGWGGSVTSASSGGGGWGSVTSASSGGGGWGSVTSASSGGGGAGGWGGSVTSASSGGGGWGGSVTSASSGGGWGGSVTSATSGGGGAAMPDGGSFVDSGTAF